MAEVVKYLAAWCSEERGIDATLDAWGLVDLADALRHDWEESEAERQLEAINRIGEMYGRKEERNAG